MPTGQHSVCNAALPSRRLQATVPNPPQGLRLRVVMRGLHGRELGTKRSESHELRLILFLLRGQTRRLHLELRKKQPCLCPPRANPQSRLRASRRREGAGRWLTVLSMALQSSMPALPLFPPYVADESLPLISRGKASISMPRSRRILSRR